MENYFLDNTLINMMIGLTLIWAFLFVFQVTFHFYRRWSIHLVMIVSILYYLFLLVVTIKAGQNLFYFWGATFFFPVSLILKGFKNIKENPVGRRFFIGICALISAAIIMMLLVKVKMNVEIIFLMLVFLQLNLVQNIFRNE